MQRLTDRVLAVCLDHLERLPAVSRTRSARTSAGAHFGVQGGHPAHDRRRSESTLSAICASLEADSP